MPINTYFNNGIILVFKSVGSWPTASGFSTFDDWFTSYAANISNSTVRNEFWGLDSNNAPGTMDITSLFSPTNQDVMWNQVPGRDPQISSEWRIKYNPSATLPGYSYSSSTTYRIYFPNHDFFEYATPDHSSVFSTFTSPPFNINSSLGPSTVFPGNAVVDITSDSFDPTWWNLLDPNSNYPVIDIVIDADALADSFSGARNLTVSVGSGNGTIFVPGCSAAGQTCAITPDVGSTVSITATPDSGWSIDSWNPVPFVPISFISNAGATIGTFTMPSFDVSISVDFTSANKEILLEVGDGSSVGGSSNNCIELLSPVGYPVDCKGGAVSLDPTTTTITVGATPHDDWEVDSWEIDGVIIAGETGESILIDITSYSSATITVNFAEKTPCVENTLIVNVVGSGSVTPGTGSYCEDDILNLEPVASGNSVFVGWTYDTSSSITLNGSTLVVPMSVNREVTATFRDASASSAASDQGIGLSGVGSTETMMFYCPSETYKDNVVSFDFTNDNPLENPSTMDMFHFRVNFYTDSDMDVLVYSAFSLSDNKRWFYKYDYFNQFASEGVEVEPNRTVNITYDPEFLPQQYSEDQKPHRVNDGVIYEKPLVCGVKYYVTIESYNLFTNNLRLLGTINLILDCNRVDSYVWIDNKDDNRWLCSGQGKVDLQISNDFNQSINPSIASNSFGIFQVVWQERREGSSPSGYVWNIYSAKWDPSNDVIYSSGQGSYNILEVYNAQMPLILSDQANNFYISGHVEDAVKFKACPFNVCDETDTSSGDGGEDGFEEFCYPGLATNLSSSYDTIKMRVFEDDIMGSLTVSGNKAVPVVNKQSIRLDIDGIPGAYAVRLRNIEDTNWGEWINIGSGLEGVEQGDDIVYDSYRIDNSRFIVPWDVEKNNGLRRVCCQILTLYGITNIFCVDFLAHFDVPQHIFKFYKADTRAEADEFPKYDGKYILSLVNGGTPESDGGVVVYFDVIFSEEIFKDKTTNASYEDGDITFNVIQQGIRDDRSSNNILTVAGDNKTFHGSFKIYNDDGIFNKDGNAFIELIFPNTTIAQSCGDDNTDDYNLVNTDLEEIASIDLSPEEIYEKYQTGQLSKALSIDEFKQFYSRDDDNFKFGNPGYYRK